jgi:hypothetical protein
MATMGNYCKAYEVRKFREYPGWTEKGSGRDVTPSDYFFLQENLTVTDGIFMDEKIVFDQVTDDWRAFCTQKLDFHIPDFDKENAELTERTSASRA